MNPLIPLAVLYFLMAVGSASVLYVSFKGQIDDSGKLFLLAEALTLPMIVLYGLINAFPSLQQSLVFFLSNLLGLTAELAILFSIHALTKVVKVKNLIKMIIFSAIYCLIMEFCRLRIDTNLPTLLYAIASCAIAISTYAAYKSSIGIDVNIKANLFFKWIGIIEIGLALFALTRIASYFLHDPIKPHNPTPIIAYFYALYIGLCVFRYIAYQSLRISWVDPRAQEPNILNSNLAKAISEKDQLLKGLISSNRVIGISSLASSLAHQISQPITSIAIQTEKVKRDFLENNLNPNLVTHLNKILFQVNKLSDLIKNLRQLFSSKNEKFHSINLQKSVDEILEIIDSTLKSKEITITKLVKSDPFIFGDKVQIQQVIINIFNNAIDALSESKNSHKEIKLVFSQNTEFAILSFEDNGIGIDPEHLPTIFDLYQTTKKEGLGIGLWLSKTIIEKHRGMISAVNSSNGGAIFEIKIPIVKFGTTQG